MTSAPLISVVLCTYNGERFIEEQVQSILQQTYPNIELIISDDASTDGTVAILEKLCLVHAIRLFLHEENKGYSKNFEFGLAQTSGDFVACCDQDDVWLKEKLLDLYSHMNGHSLVYGDSLLIDEFGKSINKKITDIRNMYSGKESYGFVFFNVVWGHALLIKKELLKEVLPIPDGIPQDIWIAYKAVTTHGIQFVNTVHTLYRQHANTYTQTLMPKQVASRTFSARYLEFLQQLYWIEVMKDHARAEEQFFYNQLYTLYKSKEKRSYNFALFFFLVKNHQKIYGFSKKNFIGRLVDIRKKARREKSL